MNKEPRVLETAHDIRQAQSLLYRVYVDEMSWLPKQDNPSSIAILKSEKLFCDKFDHAATWFGHYVEDELVACHRLIPFNGQGFELDLYHPVPDFFHNSQSCELNRLAIDERFRTRSSVFLELMYFEYQYYLKNDLQYIFTTAQFPSPGNLFCKLGLKKFEEEAFKYDKDDDHEVQLLYIDVRDTHNIQKNLTLVQKLMERMS